MRLLSLLLLGILLSTNADARPQSSTHTDSKLQLCYLENGSSIMVPQNICYSLGGSQIKK